ncbi:DUF1726 domain-containing protein [Edwardsiella ictaluri]|nr:tRNA(Met) cytidine acetyltransferase TmcA domain-containing protein [Edwardsiella ictaluri]WFO13214.1 DUF1726 domain-containing protein [Edwardsiella ictaluri]
MPLSVSLPAMSRAGVRRLLVISGEADWCRRRAALAIAPLGDVTWCGSPAPTGCQMLSLAQIRTVLGRELGHCVLDWHPGCHAEVLAALAGTLRAGSWLILLTPPWSAWAKRPDDDSLRWSEREHPIATANFVHHLQRTLSDADGVTLWRQGRCARRQCRWGVRRGGHRMARRRCSSRRYCAHCVRRPPSMWCWVPAGVASQP